MSYYHALGGFHNEANLKFIKTEENKYKLNNKLKNYIEELSIQRLEQILKDGYIKNKNMLDKKFENYPPDLQYDEDSIYVSYPYNHQKWWFTEAFIGWAGSSISLKLSDSIKLLPSFCGAYISEDSFVEGEYRIKGAIPLSYVEAICIPVYTEGLLVATSSYEDKRVLKNYFNVKKEEVDLIKKILKDNNLSLPILETYIDKEIDISSIIDEYENIFIYDRPVYIREKHFNLLEKG